MNDISSETPEEYDIHHIPLPNPPISNIFMNHPHYNTKNEEYQRAMGEFMQQSLNCLASTDLDTTKIQIPINTIDVPIHNPQEPNTIITINAAADSGSDIDAIGPAQIDKYRSKHLIKTDPKGVVIGTGNGPIHVKQYVPITTISKIGNKYTSKFWCLTSLPNYNFLLGKTTLHRLGWELVNKYEVWEHKPANVDHIEEDLDDLSCSNYPWKGEPELDLSKVRIENDTLRPFLREQLEQYKDVIARHEFDSGKFQKLKPFEIKFIDEDHPDKQGFYSKEYWTNHTQKKEVLTQLEGLHKYDMIEECTEPVYVSPIFTVPKKTGDVRIVFDYRRLNAITRKLHYPMPDTVKLLRQFRGKGFITSLDLKGGYWHVPIKPEDRYKTAFIFNNKIWQWKVMPFGPTNAPMYFQMCMKDIFGDLDYVTIYLDDISILSETVEEHIEHLRVVFDRLKRHGVKLRLDKCLWGVNSTEYLGFIVDKVGTKCKAKYVQKIMNVPIPNKKSGLKRFLGLVQFLHNYLPQMQDHIAILSKLTSTSKPNIIEWTEDQKKAFYALKESVSNADYLVHPDIDKTFHVFTDASKYGIGGMLAQQNDAGEYQPIAYCSKVFSDTQTRWHVSEQEIYAAIHCVEKWSDILRHKKFVLHTDHKNLQKLFNNATDFKSGKLFRWAVRLQDYHFECRYIKGSDNVVADYLSRESVMIQMDQFKIVHKFYAANPSYTSRQTHSNNGGVDILKLYTNHLHISILLGSQPHYLSNTDPYSILDQNDPPNTPNTSTTFDPDILSPNTHQFLQISIQDQMKLSKQKFQPKAVKTANNNTNNTIINNNTEDNTASIDTIPINSSPHAIHIQPDSNPYDTTINPPNSNPFHTNPLNPYSVSIDTNNNNTNDISDIHTNTIHTNTIYTHTTNNDDNNSIIPIYSPIDDTINLLSHKLSQIQRQLLPLDNNHNKPLADEVIGDSDDEDDLRYRLDALDSPEPYIQPSRRRAHGANQAGKTKVSGTNTKTPLRRSKRIAAKTAVIDPHQPLVYSRRDPDKNETLHKTGAHAKREAARQSVKDRNQSIINSKPYEHAWNRNLLMPKYYIPILDDYGPLWDESQHIKTNLIRFKQWEDPICFAIINFLDTGNRALIKDLPEYIKRYVLSGRFILNDSKILCYKHTKKGNIQIILQMLPSSLIASVLKRVHGPLHHGSGKMLQVIIGSMNYWWPKMRHHVKVFCKCCFTCQRTKPGVARRYTRGQMKLFKATAPFEQISVDIVGPLPTSQSCNRYIVSMIDKFTRYCMLVATQDISALSVVKAIDKWITTFGPPKSILSDNGPQFVSSIYRNYMDNHGGIKYKYTTTYHPECNGQIERLHRWIKERLALIAYDGGLDFVTGEHDWSDYLGVIQYTYNTTPNKMTSYAPMHVLLGKDAYRLPPYNFDPKDPKGYIDYLVRRQTIIHNDANEKQRIYDQLREKSYNKNTSTEEYHVHQQVLWNVNSRYHGNARKLGKKWIGPYEIIEIFNNGQSCKLKILPLPPKDKNNIMNQHSHPRRVGNHGNYQIPEVFTVPRNQIKPYYSSFECQFDGIQSPNKLTLKILTSSYDLHDKYSIIFHILQKQNTHGCTIEN